MLGRLLGRGGEAIEVDEAARRAGAGELVLVDVRDPRELRSGRAASARNVPLARLARELDALGRQGKPLAFICASGHRSAAACAAARAHGLEALNVRGGMRAYQRAGLPLARG